MVCMYVEVCAVKDAKLLSGVSQVHSMLAFIVLVPGSNGPKSPLLYMAISALMFSGCVVTEPCVEVAVSLNSW